MYIQDICNQKQLKVKMQKSQIKNVDRTGLYILVIFIVLCVCFECPGYGDRCYNNLYDKLNNIETKIASLQKQYDKRLEKYNNQRKIAETDMGLLTQLGLEIEPLQQRKELIEGLTRAAARMRKKIKRK